MLFTALMRCGHDAEIEQVFTRDYWTRRHAPLYVYPERTMYHRYIAVTYRDTSSA